MNRALGFFYVLLAGIGFGFIGIFSRIAFRSGMSVGELLTWRFACASLILWIALLFINPKLLKPNPKQILVSIALGMFGYAIFSTLYFKAIEGISVPLAALLLYTFPIFVNLVGHFFFSEKMTRLQSISLFLSCIGLGILLWGPIVVNSKIAVLYGLGSGITYAIYVLISGRVQKNIHPLSSSVYVITAATFGLFLFHQPNLHQVTQLTTTQLTCVVGLAIVSTIGPLTFFLAGLQRLPTGQASITAMIEPVVAAMAAGLILGENLTHFQMLGAGVILAALILNSLEKI
jgi:drug/metabolite transporter (DMT)-like permease